MKRHHRPLVAYIFATKGWLIFPRIITAGLEDNVMLNLKCNQCFLHSWQDINNSASVERKINVSRRIFEPGKLQSRKQDNRVESVKTYKR